MDVKKLKVAGGSHTENDHVIKEQNSGFLLSVSTSNGLSAGKFMKNDIERKQLASCRLSSSQGSAGSPFPLGLSLSHVNNNKSIQFRDKLRFPPSVNGSENWNDCRTEKSINPVEEDGGCTVSNISRCSHVQANKFFRHKTKRNNIVKSDEDVNMTHESLSTRSTPSLSYSPEALSKPYNLLNSPILTDLPCPKFKTRSLQSESTASDKFQSNSYNGNVLSDNVEESRHRVDSPLVSASFPVENINREALQPNRMVSRDGVLRLKRRSSRVVDSSSEEEKPECASAGNLSNEKSFIFDNLCETTKNRTKFYGSYFSPLQKLKQTHSPRSVIKNISLAENRDGDITTKNMNNYSKTSLSNIMSSSSSASSSSTLDVVIPRKKNTTETQRSIESVKEDRQVPNIVSRKPSIVTSSLKFTNKVETKVNLSQSSFVESHNSMRAKIAFDNEKDPQTSISVSDDLISHNKHPNPTSSSDPVNEVNTFDNEYMYENRTTIPEVTSSASDSSGSPMDTEDDEPDDIGITKYNRIISAENNFSKSVIANENKFEDKSRDITIPTNLLIKNDENNEKDVVKHEKSNKVDNDLSRSHSAIITESSASNEACMASKKLKQSNNRENRFSRELCNLYEHLIDSGASQLLTKNGQKRPIRNYGTSKRSESNDTFKKKPKSLSTMKSHDISPESTPRKRQKITRQKLKNDTNVMTKFMTQESIKSNKANKSTLSPLIPKKSRDISDIPSTTEDFHKIKKFKAKRRKNDLKDDHGGESVTVDKDGDNDNDYDYNDPAVHDCYDDDLYDDYEDDKERQCIKGVSHTDERRSRNVKPSMKKDKHGTFLLKTSQQENSTWSFDINKFVLDDKYITDRLLNLITNTNEIYNHAPLNSLDYISFFVSLKNTLTCSS